MIKFLMPYKNRQERLEYLRQYNKLHYGGNRSRILASNKKRREKLKIWLISYKKKLKCLFCFESNWICLDFHHRDPDEKSLSINRMMSNVCPKEKILEEIKKCDVLCSNCHRKVEAERWGHR